MGGQLCTGESNTVRPWQQPTFPALAEPKASHRDTFYYDILIDRLGGKF